MENDNVFKNSQIIILGLCIGAATIAGSMILAQGAYRITRFAHETITVTGSAQKEIKSDYITWSCHVSRQGTDLAGAYQSIKEDMAKVVAYLKEKQISEAEIKVTPIVTEVLRKKNKEHEETIDVGGYLLSQGVEIRSREVEKLSRVARESTELISKGLEFVSDAPEFFYTDIGKLKLEMLALATQNAKERAKSMAGSVGNRIGLMRSAKMGVFQITPVTSTDVSDWGPNDTSSYEKKVMSVVTASFAIE